MQPLQKEATVEWHLPVVGGRNLSQLRQQGAIQACGVFHLQRSHGRHVLHDLQQLLRGCKGRVNGLLNFGQQRIAILAPLWQHTM